MAITLSSAAPLASARCLDLFCGWLYDEPDTGLVLLGGEAQRHADSTGHAVYLTYTIPARAGCGPAAACACTSDDPPGTSPRSWRRRRRAAGMHLMGEVTR